MKKLYAIKSHSQYITNKPQQGVVLIVSLVFLIALTAVAVALMQNSSSDVRMSGASEDKVIATQQALSANDEVIADQLSGGTGTNGFAFPLGLFPLTGLQNNLTATLQPNTVALIDIANNNVYKLEASCPRAIKGSSEGTISCNFLRTQIVKTYGRANKNGVQTNTVIVNSGVVQQLLGKSSF